MLGVSENPESGPTRRLFLFIQCELPWELGPPDGRYLLRSEHRRGARAGDRAGDARRGQGDARARSGTVATSRRRAQASRRRGARARTGDDGERDDRRPDLGVGRAPGAGRGWPNCEPEREVAAAFAALNRVLHAQRIATADPYAREVSPAQALTIRAGWGEGEQVAEGHWLHAVELPLTGARVSASAAAPRRCARMSAWPRCWRRANGRCCARS